MTINKVALWVTVCSFAFMLSLFFTLVYERHLDREAYYVCLAKNDELLRDLQSSNRTHYCRL
jgi:hypothetical protein